MRCVFGLLFVAPLMAAPVPKELKKPDDKTALVGRWRATDESSAWFEFAADGTLKTWHVAKNTETKHGEMRWTWSVTDAKAKRARINRIADLAAGLSASELDCVYEFDGDALRFDLILAPGDPPSLQRHSLTRDK